MTETRKSQPNQTSSPATQLKGLLLDNGWKVERLLDRQTELTGHDLSSFYIVSNGSRLGFLKALDYHLAFLEEADPAKVLEKMTVTFNFERALLDICKSRKMSRIVRVLDSGTVRPPTANPHDASALVQYLIFELAAQDVRDHILSNGELDLAFSLRLAHQTAAAMRQLHSAGIAHQDLKPSSLLMFDDQRPKIADLGRASLRGVTSPHDDRACPGEIAYAPPEQLYGSVPTNWNERRLGGDLYLIGAMLLYFLTGVSMTPALLSRIDQSHHFLHWSGTYEEVLPYLQREFLGIQRELRSSLPDFLADDVVSLLARLCDLRASRRGDPRPFSRGSSYSLERVVSQLNHLARRAELHLGRESRET